MKIKQLEVTGFKSFVDQTSVLFPEGISAVVGPNGCGKSNIVDAIRWVMGEQSVKMLRGKSMEDIIFSGTEKRPPLNMAEVSLTLINENGNTPEPYREFSEIMVARRLFRSGESAYFINKQPCRLKDIQNLLMGSGVGSKTYAVVEQGRIANLIDAGPEERRLFVEEAAGTIRYKSRKNEALRKIERTRLNLVRIDDVIVEVKRQMNSLKRQARKAERYKAYQEKIRRLEVDLAMHHYKAISTEMVETEALLDSLRAADLEQESQMAKLDAAVEEIKQERAAKDQEISGHKATRYELQRTIDRLEGDLEHDAKDVERLIAEAEQLRLDIKETEEKDREVGTECRNLDQQVLALQENMEKARKAVAEEEPVEQRLRVRLAEVNQALETQKVELMDLATRRAAYQNTLQNTSQNRASLARRLEQVVKEKAQTEDELAQLNKGLTEANQNLLNIKHDLKKLSKEIESLNKSLVSKRQILAQQVRKVQTMEGEKQKTRSEYAALKKMDENFEWYKAGVRTIMKEQGLRHSDSAGIHGLVADFIEAEPSYEDAVEAALGEGLQYVIVKDQEGGVAAIDYLHAQAAGRSGFVPLKGVRPVMGVDKGAPQPQASTESLLIHHIKVKEGYEDVIRSLVGHVVIAEDLNAALQLWNRNGFPHAVVTQKGDRVCSQGILIGGGQDNASGILAKKKEIKGLEKTLARLETSTAKARSTQEQLEAETVSLEKAIQKARHTERLKAQEETAGEREVYRLGEELKHAQRRLKVLELETQQIQGEETDLQEQLSKYEELLFELTDQIQTMESEIARNSTESRETSDKLGLSTQKLVTLRLELTKLQAECDSAGNTLRRLKSFQEERAQKLLLMRRQQEQREQDREAVEKRLRGNRDKITQLYAELKNKDEVLAEMESEYQAIQHTLEKNDRALSDIGSAQQQAAQKIQQLELKQTERRMRREHLVSRIRETCHVDIESVDDRERQIGELSIEEMERGLARYREQIARIGVDVNLAAIQEFEALEERYRFLTEQRSDLVDAVDALRRVIRKINRTSLKQFMKTFRAVNEKLQEVFPTLFQGGTAKLALTDPKKPLESGVSYFVHPPGKKLTRMSLLSGGEKAMAAIALIFSLFLIKPAAFCVFDEIDAPLDDVNTYRFNQLLQDIGKNSQVILVTHNKQTMEVANALFGVTMEDKGISKLVSINLASSR